MRASILLFLGVLLVIPTGARAQTQLPGADVEDGYIEPGWFGASVDDVTWWPGRFAAEGSAFHVTTGNATSAYFHKPKAEDEPIWREVRGNYTVRATFTERSAAPNGYSQPYGLAIGADRVDTLAYTFLYCAAYGNGMFTVAGAGPGFQPFGMNAAPVPHPAVHKASAAGADVTQDITLSVRDGNVTCAINGVVVASYEHSAVVGPGRLASTDGVYGVYVGRNMDVEVTGLTVTTP